jgi:hypothetical protein
MLLFTYTLSQHNKNQAWKNQFFGSTTNRQMLDHPFRIYHSPGNKTQGFWGNRNG